MPLVEQYVTIACVSNEVGGDLVGNALWRGVRLKALLEQAGVDPAATQIVGRAVDGFTVGFPTGYAIADDREPLVAVGMNGEPLPVDHGFPARLIVPGLFGYVSATKWLTEIELTTWEAFDAYWVALGWAKEGPILTQSRIDVPRPGANLDQGTVTIAGVAWAPDRGVTAVELQIDDLDWTPATISTPDLGRDLGPVRPPVGGDRGRPSHQRPGHRWRRRRSDRRAHPPRVGRCARAPHDRRQRRLIARVSARADRRAGSRRARA